MSLQAYVYRIFVGNPEGKRHNWEDQEVDSYTILLI
jgi:hypothetical protein